MGKADQPEDGTVVYIVGHETLSALEESDFAAAVYDAIAAGDITPEEGIDMLNRENELQDGSIWG